MGRPRQQGKVYAMIQQEAEKVPDIVSGTLSICYLTAYVLLDSGAMYSFISSTFVVQVNRKLKPFIDALLVHTPIGSAVIIDHVCRECEVVIDIAVMRIHLLPLELKEFDVVLGMDMSKNHAAMDCFRKKVVFKNPGVTE